MYLRGVYEHAYVGELDPTNEEYGLSYAGDLLGPGTRPGHKDAKHVVGICPPGTYIKEFVGTLPRMYTTFTPPEKGYQDFNNWWIFSRRMNYHQYPSASIYNPIGSVRCGTAASTKRSDDTPVDLVDSDGKPINDECNEGENGCDDRKPLRKEELFPYKDILTVPSQKEANSKKLYDQFTMNTQRCEAGFDMIKVGYTIYNKTWSWPGCNNTVTSQRVTPSFYFR